MAPAPVPHAASQDKNEPLPLQFADSGEDFSASISWPSDSQPKARQVSVGGERTRSISDEGEIYHFLTVVTAHIPYCNTLLPYMPFSPKVTRVSHSLERHRDTVSLGNSKAEITHALAWSILRRMRVRAPVMKRLAPVLSIQLVAGVATVG